METRHWWIAAARTAFLALLAEAALFALITWRLKLTPLASRRFAIPLVGLILLLAFFMGLATGLAVATFVLLRLRAGDSEFLRVCGQ